MEPWDQDVSQNPNSSLVDSSKQFLGDCPVCWSGNIVPLSRWAKVPVKAEVQWYWAQAGRPMRSCACAPKWKLILPLVHRVTAWVRCVHTSSAGIAHAGSLHTGTSCMDAGMWVHPRQALRICIQSVPRRHRRRSLALSLSGELSREWVCRSSPKVRWWRFQAHGVTYHLQALALHFYLPGASFPEIKRISCDAW